MSKLLSFSLVAVLMLLFSCNRSGSAPSTGNSDSVNLQTAGTSLMDGVSETANTPEIKENLSGTVQVLSDLDFVKRITEVSDPKGFQYKGKTPCVVDFYADWCRPCIQLSPVIDELAKQYKGKVIFYQINTDRAPGIALAFGIKTIPTLLLMKPNAQPAKIVGAPAKIDLQKAVESLLLSE